MKRVRERAARRAARSLLGVSLSYVVAGTGLWLFGSLSGAFPALGLVGLTLWAVLVLTPIGDP